MLIDVFLFGGSRMFHKSYLPSILVIVSVWANLDCTQASTMVRFKTTLGSFDVQLYDDETPISVANFLSYVTTDRWDGTFVHRTVDDFVIQGGGYSLDPDVFNTTHVITDPPIQNESKFSNVRGTIGYARRRNDFDGATSQWYFNLEDNVFLDLPTGGRFAVFGHVIGNGMDVVDAIGALETVDYGSPFGEVPVINKAKVDAQGNVYAEDTVVVLNVSVIPEPTSLSLVGVGCLLASRVGTGRRRKMVL